MKTLLLMASFLILSHSSFAQPGTPAPEDMTAQPGMPGKLMDSAKDTGLIANHPDHACKADADKLCKGVKPGNGAIIKCLKDHEAELSAGCKVHGETMKAEFKEHRADIREACKEDFQKSCKGIRGPKQKLDCLRAHKTELNEACRNALPPARK